MDEKKNNNELFSAFILAGGKSSRMGEDKGLIRLNDKTMVEQVIDCLREATGVDPVIISNNQQYERFGLEVLPDLIPEKGPMGGIYTALSYARYQNCLFAPCDTPNLDPRVFSILLEKSGDSAVTIPWFKGRFHPLTGVYNKKITEDLIRHLNTDRLQIIEFVKFCGVKILDLGGVPGIDPGCFENINSKDELERLRYGVRN